jgi:hypothetical protein
VHTPVSQQPQSHVAQQHGSHEGGQALAQQAAGCTAAAGANKDRISRTKESIFVSFVSNRKTE